MMTAPLLGFTLVALGFTYLAARYRRWDWNAATFITLLGLAVWIILLAEAGNASLVSPWAWILSGTLALIAMVLLVFQACTESRNMDFWLERYSRPSKRERIARLIGKRK